MLGRHPSSWSRSSHNEYAFVFYLACCAFVDRNNTQAATMAVATIVKTFKKSVSLFSTSCAAYHLGLPSGLDQCLPPTVLCDCLDVVGKPRG